MRRACRNTAALPDNRYYKGTEYANILESLTRRRVLKCLPLSGEADDCL